MYCLGVDPGHTEEITFLGRLGNAEVFPTDKPEEVALGWEVWTSDRKYMEGTLSNLEATIQIHTKSLIRLTSVFEWWGEAS